MLKVVEERVVGEEGLVAQQSAGRDRAKGNVRRSQYSACAPIRALGLPRLVAEHPEVGPARYDPVELAASEALGSLELVLR